MGSFCKFLQKLLEKMVIFRKIWNGTPNFTKKLNIFHWDR